MNKILHFSVPILLVFLSFGFFIPAAHAQAVPPTVIGVTSDSAVFNNASSSPTTITIIFSEAVSTSTISVSPDAGGDIQSTVTDCGDPSETTWCFDYALPTVDARTETITISGARSVATNELMVPDSTHTFIVDTTLPAVSSAKITGPNQVTIVYTEPVHTDKEDYTNLIISGSPRTVDIAEGSGTNSIVLTFSGNPAVATSATGSVDIGAGVTDADVSSNLFAAITQALADGQNPTLAEAGAITTPTATATPSYTFTSSEAGTITYGGDCSSATTAASAGSNTVVFNTLSDVVHSNCTVKVTDGTGNQSSLLPVTSFTVDTTPPTGTISINSGATYTNSTSTTLTISASDASGVSEMQVYDGIDFSSAEWVPYATTLAWLLPTGEASHDVSIRFKDAVGNINPARASFDGIILDTIAPVVSQVTPITTPVNDPTPDYAFSTTEAGTAAYGGSCSGTSSGAVGVGTSTTTLASLLDGTYTNCTVTVTDAANNISNVLSIPSFTIDTTPPTVIVTTSDADAKVKAGASVTITATFSEPIKDTPAPTVTLSGAASAGPITMSKVDSTHYTYSYTAGAGNGVVTFTVGGAVDLVNNVQAVTNTATLTLDNLAPIITAPSDMLAEATSASGSVVTYTSPSAVDTLDGSVTTTCSHNSGDTFALGTTTVTCNASDAAGNAATPASFTVAVHDTTGPVIASHTTVFVEATSGAGAVATYTSPTTTDVVDGAGVASCVPTSGTALPLGDTTINCSASDAAGNQASTTAFTLTVRDTTGPVITRNGTTPDIEINTTYTELGATAADAVDGSSAATPSGSVNTAVVGDYTITYNATDAYGNAATPVTRTVHVKDSVAEAFASISAALAAPGSDIANNMNTVTSNNVTSFSGLSFEKSISGSPVGKLLFIGALDLSASTTQSFLQNLGAKLDQGNGRIAFDARTSAIFAATGATLTMYNVTPGVTASNLIVRDDSGVILNPSGIVSGFSQDPDTHAVVFSAAHFTKFDIDTTAPVIAAHADISLETTAVAGAVITYTAPNATDNIDATAVATCSPLSGTTFSVGDTTVTCNKTDTAGNVATPTTFVVHIIAATETLSISTTDNGDGTKTGTKTNSVVSATSTPAGDMEIEMPENLAVTGPSGWDGSLALPTATTTYTLTADPESTATAVAAIEIGAGDTHLEFDKAVKLTFAGQAGKLIGWSQTGVFHKITAVCDSATNPTLAAGADCAIDVGSDLVVWTKHFSTFITYTQAANPRSGSGGPGTHAWWWTPSGNTTPVVTTTPVVASATSPAVTVATPEVMTNEPQGQVLGASVYLFAKNLNVGSRGADVTALQQFLTDNKFYIGPITGAFGQMTKKAVIAFQKAKGIAQFGNVGPLTRAELNKGSVATTPETSTGGSGLTATQVGSIIAVLESFGIDEATMNQVRAALKKP